MEPGFGAIEYRRLLQGGSSEDPLPVEGPVEVSNVLFYIESGSNREINLKVVFTTY